MTLEPIFTDARTAFRRHAVRAARNQEATRQCPSPRQDGGKP